MKKLKTLKDFDWIDNPIFKILTKFKILKTEMTIKRELKKEAIKWYKEWEITNGIGSAAVLEWIKYFFNLTEGDLK